MTTQEPVKKVAYVDDLYALVYKFPEESKHFNPELPWGVQFSKNPMKYIFLNDKPNRYPSMGVTIAEAKRRVHDNVRLKGELKPSRIIHVEVREYEPYFNSHIEIESLKPIDGRTL